MTNTIARIKKAGKNFEIIVDLDLAMKFKKGENQENFLESDTVFYDSKKGLTASKLDLEKSFSTIDPHEIAKIIVKEGEILVTQEYRDESKEKKFKQLIDFLSSNAIDAQTKNPISPERIKSALNQAKINLKETPIESQIKDVINLLSQIIPIKLNTRRIKLTIPSAYTGKAYGIINPYKEREDWKSDGNLEVLVEIPTGFLIDFYDKINRATQGSILSEEVKE